MKVLHLIPSFGPGGAERQLALLAPALASHGADVHIGHCAAGPNLALLQDKGVQLHALKSKGNHDPMLAVRVHALMRRLKPDVVQTWVTQMDILGGGSALLQGIPLVVSERSTKDLYTPGWKTRCRLAIGRRAGAVVANSVGGAAYWQSQVGGERVRIIRNGVALPALTDAELFQWRRAPDARPLVLYAGRFSYEKNIPTLVAALIEVARALPHVDFAMVGEGPERADVIRMIEQAGCADRFDVPGYSAALGDWLSRASACVSVSHFEGHPNVVIEAAAHGCPLILSDIPAHREIFDDAAAWFAPKDSAAGIALAIKHALGAPDVAMARAQSARSVVSQWTLDAVAAAYLSVYRELEKRA